MQVGQIALIALGANLPNGGRTPRETVREAARLLQRGTGKTLRLSRLFRTPAFPAGAGPDFVNAAAAIPWPGRAQDLLNVLHDVEEALGRTRTNRWEARIIDLDLIAHGAVIAPDRTTYAAWSNLPPARAAKETPDRLILPHPRLAERGFVLAPLADVARDWVHPVTGATVDDMLNARPETELAEIWPLDPA